MSQWHMDSGVNEAFVALFDLLSQWERTTGRQTTVIAIPHINDEEIIMWESKSPRLTEHDIHPQELLTIALTEHTPLRRINTSPILHMDPNVSSAIIKLDDVICMWERATSREIMLIIVPHSANESIQISQSGKPLPINFDMSPEELLKFALDMRSKN